MKTYIIKAGVLYNVGEGSEKEFTSPFAEEFFAEENNAWHHESWKYEKPDDDSPMNMMPRSMLWGGRGKGRAPVRTKFDTVFETPQRLYYVLEMSTSRGLFYYDHGTGQETRLFHRAEFKPQGLFVDVNGDILTTITNPDGTVHVVQYDPDGKREQVLTAGDCRDANPYRRGSSIYYQSSGLARNAAGTVVAIGPSAIYCLDVSSGEITGVLESDKFDYLLPRVAPDGSLYCIQAPYQRRPAYRATDCILDIVLFPWRILVAVFAFLNAFSIFFAKKPLTAAGGPNPKEADMTNRILHNRLVNARETHKQEGRRVAVSRDWKLIKQAGGHTTVIARNVLWFDLDAAGNPVYTDGYSLYDHCGKRQFETDEMVTCLAASCAGAVA